MRRLLMLEKHKAWKRDFGFDYVGMAAEMDTRCSRSNIDSETFCYRNMFNPRRPHTPDEFALEMKVDVEGIRMEIIISQPTPPQCDPLPRRAAIGTGSEEPGVSRTELTVEDSFPLEISMDVILHLNCKSPEQEYILLQPDVDVDDNDKATASKVQAGACEEFARLLFGRQQRETASTEQSKQFDRGRSQSRRYFSEKKTVLSHILSVCSLFFPLFGCVLLLYFSCLVRNLPKQLRKAIGAIGMCHMRELLYQSRSVHRRLDFR